MYNDFGFDSISRLQRLRQLLTFESALRIIGTLWGTETLSSATDVSFTERGLSELQISPDTGAPDMPGYYHGTPVAPQHLGGL